MKDITLFYLKSCPYCIQAEEYINQLRQEHPAYAAIPIHMIEERDNKDIADRYDYFYVPCFYVDGEKVAEGRIEKNGVRQILDMVLEKE